MNASLDKQSSWLKCGLLIVGVGVSYYFMARFGLRFSYGQSHESPVWPPAGLALAAVVLFGWRVLPGIFLGSLAADMVLFVQIQGAPFSHALWISTVIATGNVFEPLAGWWLWRRWLGPFPRFGQEGDFLEGSSIFWFAALALLICLPTACLGAWTVCMGGYAPWPQFLTVWMIAWLGDATAVLLLTPFLIAWTQPVRIRWNPRRACEAVAAFGALAATLVVIFAEWLPERRGAYLSFVPMTWIAIRQSPRAVAGALLFLSAFAVVCTLQQQGPFGFVAQEKSILFLLLFLWVATLTSTVLAGSMAALKKSKTALVNLAGELEGRVEARTADLKKANVTLQSSLEREVILKREINHRVKNNLQVISSLLYLQSITIEDRVMQGILRESQSRVRSLALIYDKISQRGTMAGIAFGEYVEQLAKEIFAAYKVRQGTLTLGVKADGVFLDLDAAIPCGLIVTELISNILKHAFPENRKGEVQIGFDSVEGGRYCLRVCDNGIGLPEGFNLDQAKSMGLGLVRDLTRQLGGEIKFQSGQGTTITILFPKPNSVAL